MQFMAFYVRLACCAQTVSSAAGFSCSCPRFSGRVQAISLPAVPSNLALEASGNVLKISWTRPADTGTGDDTYELTKYQIEVTSEGSFSGTSLIDKLDADTSHDATGLTLDETYHARIRAINPAGNSEWSNLHGAVSQVRATWLAKGATFRNNPLFFFPPFCKQLTRSCDFRAMVLG